MIRVFGDMRATCIHSVLLLSAIYTSIFWSGQHFTDLKAVAEKSRKRREARKCNMYRDTGHLLFYFHITGRYRSFRGIDIMAKGALAHWIFMRDINGFPAITWKRRSS